LPAFPANDVHLQQQAAFPASAPPVSTATKLLVANLHPKVDKSDIRVRIRRTRAFCVDLALPFATSDTLSRP